MPEARYILVYRQSVEKDLRKLSKTLRIAIIRKIQALAVEPQPSGSVKLRASKDLYRIRHTDYRIVYQLDKGELIVLVVKVGHRREIYRDF